MRTYFVYIIIVFALWSCKKTSVSDPSDYISFSTDTLSFDTVFTSQGSFTLPLKIYNPQNKTIVLNSIKLLQGATSPFKLNINGIASVEEQNITMQANDSMYVFATVNINPNTSNSPFLVEDKLVVSFNNRVFELPLHARGQNAYYIVDSTLQTQTWKTDKPYVIIRNAAVDENQTLTIPAGCRVYMHADSRLFVLGTLEVLGTKKDSVVFQGDRLDRSYFGGKDYPGEWGGIYFTSFSKNNIIQYAIIKNGGASTKLGTGSFIPATIQVNPDSVLSATPQLTLKNTIIKNSFGYGIISFGGEIYAENCLLHDCSASVLAILQGGNYNFLNCNFLNIPGQTLAKTTHVDQPLLALLNYYDIDNVNYVPGNLSANFTNCLLWGSLSDETFINKKNGATCSVQLSNCMIKQQSSLPTFVTQNNNLFNKDPLFTSPSALNFVPKANSPLIGAGITLSQYTKDLADKTRTTPYDIGCYNH